MIQVIVGLGNIGKEYEKTRHNAGFEVLNLLRRELAPCEAARSRNSESEMATYKDNPIVLVRPTTLMNGSGLAVREILEATGSTLSELLVIVDDFNLPLGAIRFRSRGSAGGHNGLESIIEEMQTEDFPRLRLGIGPIPDDINEVDFVLGEFSKMEQSELKKMLGIAAEAVIFALGHGLREAMSRYNYNPA
jgi:PTH1 family peptidyl-tRNA hydrolase